MKLAAHVAANILAIGALSVAAGSAQKSGDGGGTRTSPVALDTTVPRPSLAIRASRSEDRGLPPTTTTTSAPIPNVATAKSPNRNGKVSHSPATSATAPDRARIRACIIENESGGNPLAHNAHSSAAGIGQWLTPTWNNWGGYATADLAPMDVQQQRMDYDMSLPMAHIQAEWAAQRKACGF